MSACLQLSLALLVVVQVLALMPKQMQTHDTLSTWKQEFSWTLAGLPEALAARDLQLQQQRAGLPAGFLRFMSGGRRLVAQAAQVRVAGRPVGSQLSRLWLLLPLFSRNCSELLKPPPRCLRACPPVIVPCARPPANVPARLPAVQALSDLGDVPEEVGRELKGALKSGQPPQEQQGQKGAQKPPQEEQQQGPPQQEGTAPQQAQQKLQLQARHSYEILRPPPQPQQRRLSWQQWDRQRQQELQQQAPQGSWLQRRWQQQQGSLRQQQRQLLSEPMFCLELAVKLFHWSKYAYRHWVSGR
jgi:hypothetical protein